MGTQGNPKLSDQALALMAGTSVDPDGSPSDLPGSWDRSPAVGRASITLAFLPGKPIIPPCRSPWFRPFPPTR